MSPYLILGLGYAVCAAITMTFVIRELRHGDGRLADQWNEMAFVVGLPILVISTLIAWPYAAWALRSGSLHRDQP